MSTAYPPRFVKYMFSSKKERNDAMASTTAMAVGDYGKFPHSFLLFYAGPGVDFLSQRFFLRENNEGLEKIYAVSYFKKPGITIASIYASIEHGGPALAIAESEKRFGSSIKTALPPPPGDNTQGSQTIPVQYNARRKGHSFAVNDGTGTQHFEWREEGKIKPKLRRLYMLSSPWMATDSSQELIAIWKEGTVPNRDGRLASFEYASPEAKTKLGDQGALAAVATVLAICGIMGSGIEGSAAWSGEKALEKGYNPDFWKEGGLTPTYTTERETWQDPWMAQRGTVKEQ